MKQVPWSVRITSKMPTQLKSKNVSLTTALAVAARRGMASGYRVA